MNEARRDLVRRIALEYTPPKARVIEVGCGTGALTKELADAGFACTAIDLSPQMVACARRLLADRAEVFEVGLSDYRPPARFSTVIANGVAPYFRDKVEFLRRLGELAVPDAAIVVTHRNALFNLFAVNQGTVDFIAEDLLSDLPAATREGVAAALSRIPGLAQPRRRASNDELYRSQENPLTIAELYRTAGLTVREIRYCFIHALPPRASPLEGIPSVADLQRRFECRWEGMFLGSQFLVLASPGRPAAVDR